LCIKHIFPPTSLFVLGPVSIHRTCLQRSVREGACNVTTASTRCRLHKLPMWPGNLPPTCCRICASSPLSPDVQYRSHTSTDLQTVFACCAHYLLYPAVHAPTLYLRTPPALHSHCHLHARQHTRGTPSCSRQCENLWKVYVRTHMRPRGR
jgi:hypothetical protein